MTKNSLCHNTYKYAMAVCKFASCIASNSQYDHIISCKRQELSVLQIKSSLSLLPLSFICYVMFILFTIYSPKKIFINLNEKKSIDFCYLNVFFVM